MPLLFFQKKVACFGCSLGVKNEKMEKKMNKKEQDKGSHITIENPITGEDLHKKLFTAVMLPHYGYKPNDTIYLYMSAQKELNQSVSFNNVDKIDKTGVVLIGKYKYQNFWSQPESALAFARTIADRVIKLSGAT